MKKQTLIILSALLILLSIVFAFASCKKQKPAGDTDKVEVSSITIDKSEMVVLKGAEFTLTATVSPEDATDKSVKWKSSDETVVTVDNAGKVIAVGTGVATVTVSTPTDEKPMACKVYSGDKIVDKAYTGNEANHFKTVAEAMTGETVGTVIIIEGAYDEDVSSERSFTLIGKGGVTLKSATSNSESAAMMLENITFSVSAYPTEATVKKTGGSLTMKNCKLMVTSEDEASGGYAVYADKCVSVTLLKNEITGYRYGVYITANNTQIEVKENKLNKLNVGIGVDVRNATTSTNYTAKGTIAENEYTETVKKTEFFYVGDSYDGELQFTDNAEKAPATEGEGDNNNPNPNPEGGETPNPDKTEEEGGNTPTPSEEQKEQGEQG